MATRSPRRTDAADATRAPRGRSGNVAVPESALARAWASFMMVSPRSRRRPLSFAGYVKRRARLAGLTLVVVAGTLLLLALTDEGHEPLWRERPGEIQTLAVSPDGGTALAVVRSGDRVTELASFDVASGDALWSKDVSFSAPASVAAGDGWFALVTPIPGARLAVYATRSGEELHSEFLGAEPRAVAADGDRLAVALRTGEVIVLDELAPLRTLMAPALLSAFDAQAGRTVAGTAEGRLVVWEGEREVVNVTRPLLIQSARLSADGTKLFIGGRAAREGDAGGRVEFFDLATTNPGEPVWTHAMRSRVSLVDVDRAGGLLIALEESAPRYRIHAWRADGGSAPAWSTSVDGAIFRDDTGRSGGVALSADGRYVAVAPDLGGPLLLLDAPTGGTLWSFKAQGASAIAFPEQSGGDRFVAAARLIANHGHDTLLGFDATREPLRADFKLFAPALVALELLAGIAALGIGYWWYRRN